MGICSFGRQFGSYRPCLGSRVYAWGFAALVGSSAVIGIVWGAVSMGIRSFGRQLWALFGEPCLCKFAALVGSYGPCLGSRVYANLQLWSAVMGLVLRFAALVGSDGPCLGSRVSVALLGEPRLWGFAALLSSYGPCLGSRVYGDLQLWSAIMGHVWGAVSMQICSFGRQLWALFGGPCLWGFALSGEPCL